MKSQPGFGGRREWEYYEGNHVYDWLSGWGGGIYWDADGRPHELIAAINEPPVQIPDDGNDWQRVAKRLMLLDDGLYMGSFTADGALDSLRDLREFCYRRFPEAKEGLLPEYRTEPCDSYIGKYGRVFKLRSSMTGKWIKRDVDLLGPPMIDPRSLGDRPSVGYSMPSRLGGPKPGNGGAVAPIPPAETDTTLQGFAEPTPSRPKTSESLWGPSQAVEPPWQPQPKPAPVQAAPATPPPQPEPQPAAPAKFKPKPLTGRKPY
jgi:hypothetical protein